MGLVDRFGDGRQLKIERDINYGLVSVTHPGRLCAAPELCVNPCTINITTEDFVTMLKWYVHQKEKEENYHAIQWSPCDECESRKSCKRNLICG